eukprot:3934610-Rhodomonas_salina.2
MASTLLSASTTCLPAPPPSSSDPPLPNFHPPFSPLFPAPYADPSTPCLHAHPLVCRVSLAWGWSCWAGWGGVGGEEEGGQALDRAPCARVVPGFAPPSAEEEQSDLGLLGGSAAGSHASAPLRPLRRRRY